MNNDYSLYDLLNKPELMPSKKLDIYSDYIMYKTMRMRELLSCVLELSPVCNLHCEVCYISRSIDDVINSGNHIMNFDEWKYYIDGLCDLGVMYFTLTGGECTLHPDFIQLYEYIYNKGKLITIMTNGTALSNSIINLFKEMPPRKMFITLYGASENTYEKFCHNRNAYKSVIENIDKLLSINIHPVINYTCGKDNISDLSATSDYVIGLGLEFRPVWSLLSYGLCDDNIISNYQITYQKFIEAKNGLTNNLDKPITEYEFSKVKKDSEIKPKGIMCNAARNSCTINWLGKMQPCVAFDAFSIDPHDVGGVKECWEQLVKWADEVPQLVECQQCIFRNRCHHCIARHYNDTHEFGKPSPRLCFKVQHPEEAAKLQAEYDRRQAEKAAKEKENSTIQGDL